MRRVERVRGVQPPRTPRPRAAAPPPAPPPPSAARTTTHSAGAFTAASDSAGRSSGATSASGSGTASMAPARQRLHQPPARRHQRQRVLQREHARQARRHVLAQLWPSIACGLHAPAPSTAAPARTRRRRAPAAPAPSASAARPRPRRRRLAAGRAPSRRSQPQVRRAACSAQRSTCCGTPARLVQPAAHPRVLRALAGEEERHARRPSPPPRRVGSRSGSPPASAARASSRVAAHQRRGGARSARRPTCSVYATSASVHVRGAPRGAPPAAPCAASSAAGAARGQRQQLPAGAPGPTGAPRAGASSSTTCALVPPMPNELTPARRGPLRPRPRPQRGVHVEGRAARSRCAGWARGSAAGRDLAVLQRQHRLDQPGDARGGVEVAHVGLHRAQRAEAARSRVRRAERLGERRDLDRVAQRGAGAVRLHVADACRARRPPPPAPRRSPRPGPRRWAR